MKCTIPEISWHNKDPVLSIDIQPNYGQDVYRLASGGTDSHILIWHVKNEESGVASLECVSDLTRHQKAVNVVRFSPSGSLLASGDDESVIILWKLRTEQDPAEFPDEKEIKNQENWIAQRILRGHLDDVYDISWSADENNIISGSVDNTAIVWDVKKGCMKNIIKDHKSFVQGVAWDPIGQYVATMSCDRIFRIFNTSNNKVVSRVFKAHLPNCKPDTKPVHLFHDDTLKTFFRRLCFSPCGNLLFVPSGIIEPQQANQKAINTTLVFTRNSLSRPVAYLPTQGQYSVAVRCCPKYFALKKSSDPPMFKLPYRIVIAIATQRSVILYDTQYLCPFAFITNIHYTRLTDITWSSDGRMLIVSSTDGYCSIITFSENELGDPYIPEEKLPEDKNSKFNELSKSDKNKHKGASKNKSDKMDIDIRKPVENAEECPKELDNVSPSKTELISDETNDFTLVIEDTVTDSSMIEAIRDTNEVITINNDNENKVPSCDSTAENIDVETIKKGITTGIAECDGDNLKTDLKDNCHKTPSKDENKLEAAQNSPTTMVELSPATCNITPLEKRKPKRVQLITLSSPKSKKKL